MPQFSNPALGRLRGLYSPNSPDQAVDYQAPGESSATLAGLPSELHNNPEIQNYLSQDRLKSETEDRLFNAQRGGSPDVQALKGLLGRQEQSLGETAVARQQPELAMNQQARNRASLAGFGSPQEAALAGRQAEMTKIQMPQKVAETEAAGNLARQQEASRGALGVQKEVQAGKGSQYDLVRELMSGGMGGGDRVHSVTIPGVFGATFNQDPKIGAPIIKQLEAARDKVKNAWGFMGGKDSAQQELNQLVGLAVPQGLMPEHIKQWVEGIAQDPAYTGMNIDQIMQKSGQTDLDPLEKAFANYHLQNRQQ